VLNNGLDNKLVLSDNVLVTGLKDNSDNLLDVSQDHLEEWLNKESIV